MANRIRDIKLALDTRLASLSGGTPVAWDNGLVEPHINTMYIRPTLMPAKADTALMNGVQHDKGLYQIDVIAPINTYVKVILDKLDQIYDLFQRQTLTKGDIQVIIRAVSFSTLRRDDAWFLGSVVLEWDCYTN